MVPFALLLAGVWGILWALFLQLVPLGRWLAQRRTWLTVVVGLGVDLLILLLVLPLAAWWPVAAVIACSGLGIVARSLLIEYAEHRELLDGLKNPARQ
jgi:hypothetical protein